MTEHASSPIPSDDPPIAGLSRRTWLTAWTLILGPIAAGLLATPVIGYFLGPILRRREEKWVILGPLTEFPVGQTRLIDFDAPPASPWDGQTARQAAYVRRTSADALTVFAVNCAHLGCPVNWFPQSGLFMCPCHGGVYYADGSRASGPPPHGLFLYEHRVVDGRIEIKAGDLPTLGIGMAGIAKS